MSMSSGYAIGLRPGDGPRALDRWGSSVSSILRGDVVEAGCGLPRGASDSEGCELSSESRRSPDAARCAASCKALPSSERIFCLILAAKELCASSSCLDASGSGVCGSEGTGSVESSLSRSFIVLKPVWVRWSDFGLKSSSSSWIVGSRADAVLGTTGERLSESCEYTESSLARLMGGCIPGSIMLSKPVGARERPLGRSPRPMEPR